MADASHTLGRGDVLAVCRSGDAHVDRVFAHLPADVQTCRLELDRFPDEVGLEFRFDRGGSRRLVAETDAGTFDLSGVGVVWLRSVDGRTDLPRTPSACFVEDETRSTVAALMHFLAAPRG